MTAACVALCGGYIERTTLLFYLFCYTYCTSGSNKAEKLLAWPGLTWPVAPVVILLHKQWLYSQHGLLLWETHKNTRTQLAHSHSCWCWCYAASYSAVVSRGTGGQHLSTLRQGLSRGLNCSFNPQNGRWTMHKGPLSLQTSHYRGVSSRQSIFSSSTSL